MTFQQWADDYGSEPGSDKEATVLNCGDVLFDAYAAGYKTCKAELQGNQALTGPRLVAILRQAVLYEKELPTWMRVFMNLLEGE